MKQPPPLFRDRLFDALQWLRSKEREPITSAELFRRAAERMGRAEFSSGRPSQIAKSPTPPPWQVCLALAEVCGVDPGWLTYGPASDAAMIRRREKEAEGYREPLEAPTPPQTRPEDIGEDERRRGRA